ncbi:MAG: hypothetical protein JST36_02430 [Bacteroidetes bacterium]|nr:hypothetical protein [Bacteroidota bacterium]
MNGHNEIWDSDRNRKTSINEAQMKAYLEGTLSRADQRKVEEMLSLDGAESDALEGLQKLTSTERTVLQQQLNYTLQNALRKPRKRRRGLASQRWNLLAILLILGLAVVAVLFIIWNGNR